MTRVTVVDLVGVQPRDLPASLRTLPGVAHKVQSRSFRNAADLTAGRMSGPVTKGESERASYRRLRDNLYAKAKELSLETHSVVMQIMTLVERRTVTPDARLTMLGAVNFKLDDLHFLVALRDTLDA